VNDVRPVQDFDGENNGGDDVHNLQKWGKHVTSSPSSGDFPQLTLPYREPSDTQGGTRFDTERYSGPKGRTHEILNTTPAAIMAKSTRSGQ
jgi:hypothetical protein